MQKIVFKRMTTLLLSGVLVASMLAGCSGKGSGGGTETASTTAKEKTTAAATTAAAEAETEGTNTGSEYADHLSFTATTWYSYTDAATGADYTDNSFHKWITEKFNVDYELWACAASEAAEKERLWINGGTMPDMMTWYSHDRRAYRNYVDQGLFKALPDDWKTRWPNIAKSVAASGAEGVFTIDGKIYTIPVTTYCNFLEVKTQSPHAISVTFRKDWAKQLGMENLGADNTISMSELKEYLEKVKEAGLAQYPLGSIMGNLERLFYFGTATNQQPFVEKKNGFVYEPAEEEFLEMISTMQSWYQEGLIDEEFYNKTDMMDYKAAFTTGQCAAMFSEDTPSSIEELEKLFDLNGDVGDDGAFGNLFDLAAIKADDGVVYTSGMYNYWKSTVFSPDIDDAVFERILDMIDYFCTEEGEISKQRGIPGVEWEFADDGSINQLDGDFDTHMKYGEWNCVATHFDDLTASQYSSYPEKWTEKFRTLFNLKINGTLLPQSDKYERFASETKNNYAVPIQNTIVDIVVSGKDVESTWNEMLEENRGLWEPLLDELNAEYYPN